MFIDYDFLIYCLQHLGYALLVIVPVLLCVAYLIYAERRVIGMINLRHGPVIVGPFGLLQPIADAIKLLCKEIIVPQRSSKLAFTVAPLTLFIVALLGWAVIPFGAEVLSNGMNTVIVPTVISNINVGVLYLLALSSIAVYGIIVAGWSSNSNYAFFGALRSASQMISYEVSMGLTATTVLIVTSSMRIGDIVVIKHSLPYWVDILLLPAAVVFFVSALAETNRHPFDLPEAESELVAGYNVEYSSMPFALFFLGEYSSMILVSATMTVLFLGGWYPILNLDFLYLIPGFIWFALKVSALLFVFIWIRATLPRYRYDQLMSLGWKKLLPFSLLWVLVTAGAKLYVK